MLAHWHIRSVLLAFLVLTYASAAEDTNEPSGLPTFRSIVSQVRVTFFATDENNRLVAPLTKSDFAVVDSELVVRDFRSFTPADDTSLDVVALVDLSESVAPRLRVAMSAVLQLIARQQSIPDDNIAVLSFGGTLGGAFGGEDGIHPAVVCSNGCHAADSVNRLLAVKSGGTTPLFDALLFGADFVSHHRRAGVRRVLILFSDGNDTISMHSAREALDAVLNEGALVYSVDTGTSRYLSSKQRAGSMFLRQVSDATGGRYFPLHFAPNDGAANVLDAALEDLRASYVVTYDLPSHQAGFHSLCLMPTHNLNLTFHSRNGYYYEPSVR
jgi:Ca-activated chloride channel family protein